MNRKLLFLMSTFFLIGYLSSCSKASEDVLAANDLPCDTAGMKYSADILPILTANCYSCHGGGATEGDINLAGHANLLIQVNNGNLNGAITHASGYTPMPYNGGKLSDCEISKIQAWIRNGAPDN